jgi:precorrin-6B methylase 1
MKAFFVIGLVVVLIALSSLTSWLLNRGVDEHQVKVSERLYEDAERFRAEATRLKKIEGGNHE